LLSGSSISTRAGCATSPRERDTLLLPAAELTGIAIGEFRAPHELERLVRPVLAQPLAHAAHLERVRDVLAHSHVRPQRVRLEDHAHVPLVRRHVDARSAVEDGLLAEPERSTVGRLEARDATECRGLAASARPEEDEELAVVDHEVKPLDHDIPAVLLGQAVDRHTRHCRTPLRACRARCARRRSRR